MDELTTGDVVFAICVGVIWLITISIWMDSQG